MWTALEIRAVLERHASHQCLSAVSPMWTEQCRSNAFVARESPMPFGCESYVDTGPEYPPDPMPESPMPFGCESYVDTAALLELGRIQSMVTNAFRL